MRRPRHPMPDDIEQALARAGASRPYEERPPYQRNDYIRWISAARTSETRETRIGRMIHELLKGGVYMGMPHPPSRRD